MSSRTILPEHLARRVEVSEVQDLADDLQRGVYSMHRKRNGRRGGWSNAVSRMPSEKRIRDSDYFAMLWFTPKADLPDQAKYVPQGQAGYLLSRTMGKPEHGIRLGFKIESYMNPEWSWSSFSYLLAQSDDVRGRLDQLLSAGWEVRASVIEPGQNGARQYHELRSSEDVVDFVAQTTPQVESLQPSIEVYRVVPSEQVLGWKDKCGDRILEVFWEGRDIVEQVLGVIEKPPLDQEQVMKEFLDHNGSAGSLGSIGQLLLTSPNLILEGVPGTGKTHAAGLLRTLPVPPTTRFPQARVRFEPDQAITFHPSTSYEDFVEGLRPPAARPPAGLEAEQKEVLICGPNGEKDNKLPWFFRPLEGEPAAEPAAGSAEGWRVQDGFILRVCAKALTDPENVYLVLLDELNRANVPKVLGDLLTTMEASKRAQWKAEGTGVKENRGCWDITPCQPVTLPYSGRLFFMPDNVWLLGTMNTTDQSVAPLDAALRRRFWFHRLEPVVEESLAKDYACSSVSAGEALKPTILLVKKINKVLREEVGPDALLGHSYLYELGARLKGLGEGTAGDETIAQQWRYVLLPQLIATLHATRSLHLLGKNGALSAVLNQALPGKDGKLAITLEGSDLFQDAVVNLGTADFKVKALAYRASSTSDPSQE